MIANHGQQKTYYHDFVGVNSRLDSIQAAILGIKLRHLDAYAEARQTAAAAYDAGLMEVPELVLPARQHNSTHVFHQYTLRVRNGQRDALQVFLREKGIPSMIYYPVPLYKQEAYSTFAAPGFELPVTEQLCREVISLPMHTELSREMLDTIVTTVKSFFA